MLRAWASRAEHGSQLQRDLIIASDILSNADVEIEERKMIRDARLSEWISHQSMTEKLVKGVR